MKDLRPIYYHEARERLAGNRLAVYRALCEIGPATGTVLSEYMHWPVTSVRPRLCELREMRFAETTGTRRDGEHEFRALSHAEARAIIQAEQMGRVMDEVFESIDPKNRPYICTEPKAAGACERQLSLL